jgi:UDP-N-acetylglucosamine 2-epimerase (non-hydrolysing)
MPSTEASDKHAGDPVRTSVMVVVGTRPEAIKMVPLILALRESSELHPIVVATGQHHQMVAEIFGLAGIEADTELWVGPPDARLNEIVPAVITRFEDYCRTEFGDRGAKVASDEEVLSGEYPAAVVVHGDTSSAMAAALAAFHLRIPVVHAEAGLRTGGNILSPFPEELNRELISRIACFHLAPTPRNKENLVHEETPFGQVFVTGNTGIDALRWAASLDVPYEDERLERIQESDVRLVVVTAHRRENWDGGLGRIADGIGQLAESHPEVRWVIPLHPNPRVRDQLGAPLEGRENVILTEPIGYVAFARLLARSYMVLTDSGGIQEEAPSLGKPVLVMRDSTERTEGLDAGTLRLVGTDPQVIVGEAEQLLSDEAAYREMAEAENPYGDGKAAERIVAALQNLRDGGPAPMPYGSGYNRWAVLEAAGYASGLHPHTFSEGERGRSDGAAHEELWHRQ